MKALFITSQKMKSAFRAANPTLIQLDTSFEFEKARYKVAAFCYLDPNSDKTEIAAYAMMSEESVLSLFSASFQGSVSARTSSSSSTRTSRSVGRSRKFSPQP